MTKNKILLIVNEFPPTGESGVQRPVKFLKYLDRLNWETFVITPKEPVKTILDSSLEEDIPISSHIIKTNSWAIKAKSKSKIETVRYENSGDKRKSIKWRVLKGINDLLFPIDKQIGWVPFAYIQAVKTIKKHNIRNIYITAFPFSAFFVGILLKFRFGNRVFFLADYRDSWGYEPKIDEQVSQLRLKIMRFFDKLTLQKCDYMLSVTRPIIDEYIANYPFVASKSKLITNGFDSDDFKGLTPKVFKKKSIVYMGKFYNFKGSPIPFFNALDRYMKETREDIEVIHIGTSPQELRDYVKEKGYSFYRYLGYKSHSEAIEYCLGADYLLLAINNDENSKYVYSGKLFEYIKVGKPLIAIVPPAGIVEELVEQYKLGVCANIDVEEEIYQSLLKLKEQNFSAIPDEVIYQFSREKLTKDLVEIYEKN